MRLRPRLLVALPVIAAACGGSGGDSRPRPGACGEPDAKVVAAAVVEFVAMAQPRAYRYLLPTGGDSILPDAARAALQMKGQTFLFPADSAQRRQVMNRLADGGDWTTMLVAYRGTQLVTRDSAVVRFGGHYVSVRGTPPPASVSAEVPFVCSVVWKLARTAKKSG